MLSLFAYQHLGLKCSFTITLSFLSVLDSMIDYNFVRYLYLVVYSNSVYNRLVGDQGLRRIRFLLFSYF